MIRLEKILVPTDFSDCSQAAVRHGLELARAFDATLHLLHVVGDPDTAAWIHGFPIPAREILEHFQEEARRRLLAPVEDSDRTRVVVSCPIGAPATEIVRHARDESIDLIVMGTHGRGFVAHVLIGSVAERVVRRAPCPVLTVRRPQHSFVTVSTQSAAAVAP